MLYIIAITCEPMMQSIGALASITVSFTVMYQIHCVIHYRGVHAKINFYNINAIYY